MDTKLEKQYNGLEGQFFTWQRWDDVGLAEFHFYDCVLTTNMGKFKKGDTIPCVFFSVENSIMEFYDENANPTQKFKLKIEAQPWK